MERTIVLHVPTNSRELEGLALRSVLGVPIFLRTILTLSEIGAKEFTILCSARMRLPIQKIWSRYMAPRGSRLQFVILNHEGQLDPEETTKLLKINSSEFYLFDALTVITKEMAQETLETKRLCHTDRDLPSQLQAHNNAGEAKVERRFCRINSRASIEVLEHFLCEHIRLSANGWIAMNINKRISLPISRILSRLKISPNSITIFNIIVGFAAGIATAGVSYLSLLCGGILFQTASVLDGCDGEVAKLTHRTSKFGQLIDTVSDNLSLVVFFVGLTIHHIRVSNSIVPIALSVLLFAGVGTLITIMMQYQRKYSDSLSLVTFDRIFLQIAEKRNSIAGKITRYGKVLLKKEWFSIIFMFMAVLGILPFTMHLVILGTWIGVFTIIQLKREMRFEDNYEAPFKKVINNA